MVEAPRWPNRVENLCRELRLAPEDSRRSSLQAELWVLLNVALHRYLDHHSGRVGSFAREDLEDIASQKSLELLRCAESGSWEPSGRGAAEIAGYLSTVARNGLIDHARRARRGAPYSEEWDDPSELEPPAVTEETPDVQVERREFLGALRGCVETLTPRLRTIWFFRVFYDMTSKDIARHPEVGLNAGHVDVLLQRCRDGIRDCMKRKGHSSDQVPPGTFVELWQCLRADAVTSIPEQAIDVPR